MRRLAALTAAVLLGGSLAAPAVAVGDALNTYVTGPGAHTRWISVVANDHGTFTRTETGLVLYNEVVWPVPRVGPAEPFTVVYQLVSDCTDPDNCTDLSLAYGTTDTMTWSVDWPNVVSASGEVTLYPYAGWDMTPVPGTPMTVSFDETWTGFGKIERSNAPASAWGVAGVEHHVFKMGPNNDRPATLSVADPFAGSLGDLGDLVMSALFNVRLNFVDVCHNGAPDPNTGMCP